MGSRRGSRSLSPLASGTGRSRLAQSLIGARVPVMRSPTGVVGLARPGDVSHADRSGVAQNVVTSRSPSPLASGTGLSRLAQSPMGASVPVTRSPIVSTAGVDGLARPTVHLWDQVGTHASASGRSAQTKDGFVKYCTQRMGCRSVRGNSALWPRDGPEEVLRQPLRLTLILSIERDDYYATPKARRYCPLTGLAMAWPWFKLSHGHRHPTPGYGRLPTP